MLRSSIKRLKKRVSSGLLVRKFANRRSLNMSTPHEDEIRLNNDIVKEAISIKEGLPCSDTVENVSYEVRMGSEKGDNFTCTIFALSAKGTIKGSEEKTYEFIAKVIPVEPSRVDFVKYSRGVVATKDEALSNDLNTFFGAKNPADCINELLAKQSPMQLVLHGDGWVNNFLFKYNEKGDPIDMVAVDFQISRVGDPCQDVSHLMFPCTSPKERKEKWEAWLCHYYKSLKTHMKIMGYELESLYPEESMKNMHMLTDEAKEGGSMDMDNFKGQELSDVMQSTDKTIESILKCDNSLKQRLVDLAREAKENGIF
ncbi:unnamed protein product [Lepeophtheirus salmonis]|uniref:(salmon louse) hypothetical protein n=1 Tax=Lepeophtheirus salmonis TaxID=72036 RepID=A0A7R8CF40_LEPSM|nr:unnamed protein product [Lepeophtheirus salmonis]CAF2802875.1 unnamed protein product [Lepeophtheirus salmonis]